MEPYKILLVEDELLLRKSLELNLGRQGFLVTGVSCGLEGLDQLRKQPYDLLITDYFMAEMNGSEFIVEARKQDDMLKVIVISGFFSKDIESELHQLKADCFLPKPVVLDELIAAIDNVACSSSDFM